MSTEDYIQGPPDNSGKRLRARKATIGGTDVEAPVIHIADPTTPAQILVVDASGSIRTKTTLGLLDPARLQPWYQPHFQPIDLLYSAANIAPHAITDRFTYTVPANRIAMVRSGWIQIMRDAAPGVVDRAVAVIFKKSVGGVTVCILFDIEEITAVVGIPRTGSIGESMILVAGEQLIGRTYDLSTGGTYTYRVSADVAEFDT
jgi:hypothetical protein